MVPVEEGSDHDAQVHDEAGVPLHPLHQVHQVGHGHRHPGLPLPKGGVAIAGHQVFREAGHPLPRRGPEPPAPGGSPSCAAVIWKTCISDPLQDGKTRTRFSEGFLLSVA